MVDLEALKKQVQEVAASIEYKEIVPKVQQWLDAAGERIKIKPTVGTVSISLGDRLIRSVSLTWALPQEQVVLDLHFENDEIRYTFQNKNDGHKGTLGYAWADAEVILRLLDCVEETKMAAENKKTYTAAACPNCHTPLQRSNFRTGSVDHPGHEVAACPKCGTHRKSNEQQPETDQED